MNKNKPGGDYKSRITSRIALQYILALAGFVGGFLFLVLLGYSFTQLFVWQITNPIYHILQFIKEYIPFFLGVPLIAGWALITYYFMGRPLRYLDEVITASEKLAHPTEEQIILSDAMKSVQDELNEVREAALHSAQLTKEAEQRKNDLIVYLAHDLKTPLTSVIGYLTLLRDEQQISQELREKYLSISLDKAQRLEDLINEFFEITRFNLSDITLETSKVNLTRLFEQLIFEFQPMLASKNLQCKLLAAPDVLMSCDADKMQRVFDNLLRNAVNYSFEGSDIDIEVTQSDAATKVRFINCGNSIPQEKLARLFEQFYRLDTARTTKNGGAGVGLAIAKKIVELHGGAIKASSEGEIITFDLTIPSAP